MSITHYLDINTLLGDTFGQWLTAQGATFENAQDLTEATVIAQEWATPAPYGYQKSVARRTLTANNVTIDGELYPSITFTLGLMDLIDAAITKQPVAPASGYPLNFHSGQ